MSYISRGSLSSIKYNKSNNEDIDYEWESQVISSMMSLGDYFNCDYYEDSENEIVSRLWGVYERENNPYINISNFNEKHFTRG